VIGAALVVAAVVGFLSATWEQLDTTGRGMVLLAAAVGTTAAAVQLENGRRATSSTLTSLVWLVGTALMGGGVLLLASGGLDTPSRLSALLGGLAATAHGAVALRRAPDAALRQLGVVGGLLLAAGPFGTAATERLTDATALDVVRPVAGLVDPTLTSDRYLITGPAHLAIGLAWLVYGLRLRGAAARLAEIGGTLLLGHAALQLLVLDEPLGAFVALLVVLAHLVHGLVTDRAGRVVGGAVLVLATGGRVLWALFSGEVAVTVAALVVGLGLLTWAVRARQAAPDNEPATTPDNEPATTPDNEPATTPAGSTDRT